MDYDLEVFRSFQPKLTANPSPALKQLSEALGEIYKTYLAIDEALNDFLSMWFAPGDPSSINTQRRKLLELEGGRVGVQMAQARGHCSKIDLIYERDLKTWFPTVLDKTESNNIEGIFVSLTSQDAFLIKAIENTAVWLAAKASEVLDDLERNDYPQANNVVSAARREILEDRKLLSSNLIELYALQSSFIYASGST